MEASTPKHVCCSPMFCVMLQYGLTNIHMKRFCFKINTTILWFDNYMYVAVLNDCTTLFITGHQSVWSQCSEHVWHPGQSKSRQPQ